MYIYFMHQTSISSFSLQELKYTCKLIQSRNGLFKYLADAHRIYTHLLYIDVTHITVALITGQFVA